MIIDWVAKRSDISEIYLHVQTNNDDAHSFYRKFGFAVTSTVEKYYQRIEPTSANILTRVCVRPAP
jgi:ribosomal protein S18 acetylase RimI-like enzyme